MSDDETELLKLVAADPEGVVVAGPFATPEIKLLARRGFLALEGVSLGGTLDGDKAFSSWKITPIGKAEASKILLTAR